MSSKSVLIFLFSLGLLALASCASAPAPTALKKAEPAEPFTVPVVELSGPPAQIGMTHGQQLSAPIHFLFENYLKPYFHNDMHRFVALTAAQAFERHLLPEHRQELGALAHETALDERELMLAQCFLDLSPMTACSTITLPASAAPDHVARFGRNLDFPSLGVADKQTVLMIYRPQGRYQFAAVSWPGMMGVLSGMNEHGLTLANMEVDRPGRLPMAMPYTLLYRTVLEQCRTVDEAIAFLQKTPRQTANNLMLMDAGGNRAVVEITPEKITVRRAGENAALISTNHQRGTDCDSSGRCYRYDYLHDESARAFGHADVKLLESMLGHVAQGNMTLQSMIFEPANRVIYLATGQNAPQHIYGRLDLRRYFSLTTAKANPS